MKLQYATTCYILFSLLLIQAMPEVQGVLLFAQGRLWEPAMCALPSVP